jgi:microcompartment protein CcmL/EutN
MTITSNALGLIELSCIHKGFEVLDRVLKAAFVEKILARTICSGKYLILVRGELADVESAMVTAKETADYGLVNALVISNVDERIFPAISAATPFSGATPDAMLIIETFSVAACLKAADYVLKEATVDLIRLNVAMALGGKGYMVFGGSTDALRSALGPALEFLGQEGSLVGYSLITGPQDAMMQELL